MACSLFFQIPELYPNFPRHIHTGFAEIFNQESNQQLGNILGAPGTLHGITQLACHRVLSLFRTTWVWVPKLSNLK